jgi:hypothetical protein
LSTELHAQKSANAIEAAFRNREKASGASSRWRVDPKQIDLNVNIEERPGFKPHFLFLMKNAD